MTMPFHQLDTDAQVAALLPLARQILAQYPVGDVAELESINHEYNSTFSVQAIGGQKYALRINVNSARTPANLSAELWWMSQIQAVTVPKPVANQDARLSTSVWFEPLNRQLHAVLFEWLPGQEVGDEPTDQQLTAMGAAMARLHLESARLQLPPDASLPNLQDPWWGEPNLLAHPTEQLAASQVAAIAQAQDKISAIVDQLYATGTPQLIHADLHGWNLMWHQGQLAVFDFDDAGIGLRQQDIATALYYLDTPQERQTWLAGYNQITDAPAGQEAWLPALLVQRRLHLLNYLVGSTNPEHRAMVADYLAETIRRIDQYMGKGH